MEWILAKELIDYKVAINEMERMVNEIIKGERQETIWLLEHTEIYTAGTSTKDAHLKNIVGAPVVRTNRGGQLTFHGPGQRIIYIMINLKRFSFDIKKFVHFLEQLVINTFEDLNIKTHRLKNAIGIWSYKKNNGINDLINCKIASIGIRIRKKISFHGISVNINPDLDYFNRIIPCGLENVKSTSAYDLGKKIKLSEFDKALKLNFNKLLKNDTFL